jgi:hypothetical protein
MITLSLFEKILLCCHKPNLAEYITTFNGIFADSEHFTEIDRAYATLEREGLVTQCTRIKMTPFHGAIPKKPFILTETGEAERERLLQNQPR